MCLAAMLQVLVYLCLLVLACLKQNKERPNGFWVVV
jgi:hypothetical protein